MSKIHQVDFHGNVYWPHSRAATNTIIASKCESITRHGDGVVVTTLHRDRRYSSLYPWPLIRGVCFESIALTEKEIADIETKRLKAIEDAQRKAFEDAKANVEAQAAQ